MIHTALVTVTAAQEEPVTLEEAKAHLRVPTTSTAEDGLILSLVRAATRAVERETDLALITRTLRASYDGFPVVSRDYLTHREAFLTAGGRAGEIWLPYPPLQSVSSVTYTDTAGTTQTLAASGYQVDTESRPGRVAPAYSTFWPVTRPETVNAVQVTYVAGFGLADDVPEDLRQAILLTVAQLHCNRGDGPVAIPEAAKWLLAGNWVGAV